ncbi:Uncharacterised protein [Acinetobacter baumannii]|nr:Uncharacterised protein [Acinetobacter baumannii]
MKERNARLRAAIAFRLASASASPMPAGRSSTLLPLMLSGITLPISASSES